MSYCRFRNTYKDLLDCYDCIDDEELSKDEQEARIRLIKLCKKIAGENDENT
ncbi:MAG: hypothetical protein WC389_16805 [Lutibacter sp.]